MNRQKNLHIDSSVSRRLETLFAELQEYQKVTSRAVTVIVLPHRHDEPAIVWENGRIEPGADPVAAARTVMQHRAQSEESRG